MFIGSWREFLTAFWRAPVHLTDVGGRRELLILAESVQKLTAKFGRRLQLDHHS